MSINHVLNRIKGVYQDVPKDAPTLTKAPATRPGFILLLLQFPW